MSESNGNRPKVEIALNEEATLTLLRDKCYTGQNNYGNFYLYAVSEDGQEKSLFATEDVHKAILENGLRSGDAFLIRKRPIQNGRKIVAKIDFEVVNKAVPVPSNGNGNGHAPDPSADNRFRDMMELSLRDAIEATKAMNTVQWDVDSIRAIALTIFIQRDRA
jgi:hypothetical protein